MKKKKISLKLVTLVMSGTLLATPMVSSAEEVGNNSTTSSTNTSESTAGTGSTATASENTAGTGSTTSTSAALAGDGVNLLSVSELQKYTLIKVLNFSIILLSFLCHVKIL